jgi:hypothetical protein
VVNLPPDEPEAADAGGPREEIITWRLPGETARIVPQNGVMD